MAHPTLAGGTQTGIHEPDVATAEAASVLGE